MISFYQTTFWMAAIHKLEDELLDMEYEINTLNHAYIRKMQ